MSNPYQAPQFVDNVVAAELAPIDRERLRRTARYQRWAIFALLGQILLYVMYGFIQAAGLPELARLSLLAFWPLAIFGMVAVFLLARQVVHVVVAVICMPLMLVPCLSLLVLLVINGRATRLLQSHGVKVGFLGANPDFV